jgi:ribonuclease HI
VPRSGGRRREGGARRHYTTGAGAGGAAVARARGGMARAGRGTAARSGDGDGRGAGSGGLRSGGGGDGAAGRSGGGGKDSGRKRGRARGRRVHCGRGARGKPSGGRSGGAHRDGRRRGEKRRRERGTGRQPSEGRGGGADTGGGRRRERRGGERGAGSKAGRRGGRGGGRGRSGGGAASSRGGGARHGRGGVGGEARRGAGRGGDCRGKACRGESGRRRGERRSQQGSAGGEDAALHEGSFAADNGGAHAKGPDAGTRKRRTGADAATGTKAGAHGGAERPAARGDEVGAETPRCARGGGPRPKNKGQQQRTEKGRKIGIKTGGRAASPTVAAMAGQTLALQASSPDGPLYFDGGAREGKAAFGVWKSDAEYTGRLLGNETAQTAEVAGLAACMAIALGMARRGAKQITIRGDSHYALATAIQAYETVLAQPGRSPQHRLWKRIAAIRAQIPAGCALQFEWLPRAANTKADHICTSLLRGTVAAPGAVQATPAPATIEMTNAVFEQIAARALEGKLGRNIRSIPPRLTVLWRAVVEGVVAWSPAALFLAPLVLLQKAGPPLRARLLKYVSCPSLVRMAFAAAAAGSDPPEEARKTDRRVIIEKLAAIAPGKALKAIRPSEPPVDLQAPAARAAATAKVHATPATIEEVSAERAAIPMNPARLPATSPELIATIVKRDLAHAASPGPDGWTRELLLASFSAASKDAFAAIVNGWLGEKSILPPVVDALARASAVVAWKKPAANGLRVVGMTGALAKAAWKIAIATYFSPRAAAEQRRVRPSRRSEWSQSRQRVDRRRSGRSRRRRRRRLLRDAPRASHQQDCGHGGRATSALGLRRRDAFVRRRRAFFCRRRPPAGLRGCRAAVRDCERSGR